AREPEPFSREPGTERGAVKGYPGPSTKCCEAPNASLRTHHSKSLCQTSDASAPPHCGAWPEGGVGPPLTGGLVGVRFSDGRWCDFFRRLRGHGLGSERAVLALACGKRDPERKGEQEGDSPHRLKPPSVASARGT